MFCRCNVESFLRKVGKIGRDFRLLWLRYKFVRFWQWIVGDGFGNLFSGFRFGFPVFDDSFPVFDDSFTVPMGHFRFPMTHFRFPMSHFRFR